MVEGCQLWQLVAESQRPAIHFEHVKSGIQSLVAATRIAGLNKKLLEFSVINSKSRREINLFQIFCNKEFMLEIQEFMLEIQEVCCL